MSLYKRRKTWHVDAVVNGIRYRQSLGTTDWREARRLEPERIEQLKKRAPDLQKRGKSYCSMTVAAAIEAYSAERRAPGIAANVCLLEGTKTATRSLLQNH
ncbi:MAG TPA: hypothetical protein VE135_10480 [Pyrinomonadaceae bacterium]|nr:hypothetical protein [Pyrinomonadaceae bacterium]